MTFVHNFCAVLRKELKGGPFYRAALILSFLCLLGGASLLAQDATGLDAQTGILPFQSYHGGEIDKVNLSNGKLDVRIPLVSYGQRGGKMKIEYALIYTNTGLFIPGCLPTAFSSGACAIIFPFQSGFSGPTELGSVSGGLGCTQKVTQDAHGNQLFSYPCVATLSTPDGGAHQMVPISPTSFMAADGTGYRIDMLPGFDVTNPNHQASVVTTPDGVRFPGEFFDTPSANPVVEEDSNGNMIVQNGSGLLDTLGRDIPAVTSSLSGLPGGVPPGTGNTDSSGCTGSLPIVSTSLWIPPGVDGGDYPIKFCYVNVAEINPGGIQNFDSCGLPPAGCQQFDEVLPPLPTVAGQLQSVVLPNGTAWTFEYATDGTGNLSKITFPTGGTITYTWTRMDLDGPAQINSLPPFTKIQPMGVATRIVDPNDGSSPAGTWQYNYIRGQAGPTGLGSPFVTTVTDPELNDTVHTYAQFDLQSNIYETLTQYFQGPATSNHLLKSVQADYKSFQVRSPSLPALGGVYQALLPFGWTTTLDNGLQRREEQDWDLGFLPSSAIYLQDLNNNIQVTPCGSANGCSGGAPYGQIVASREFDYGENGPGGLLRSTSISHLAFTNSAYLNNNLLSLVSSKSMTDGAANTVSSVTDRYDEIALLPSGISTGHDANPPAGTVRGNLTSETENIQEPANSCNNNIPASSQPTAKFSYYDTGMVAQSLDALQQPTNITYSADFKGAFPLRFAMC
jgi:YD repeat-containing protein